MKRLEINNYGDIGNNIDFGEVPNPELKNNQVLVEVHAAAVNPIDYKIIGGAFKQISPLTFPAPIGFDVSGVVAEVGSEVKNFNIGDEIFSRVSTHSVGTFAEYIAVDAEVVAQKPKNLTFEEAAGIPLVGLTTFQVFLDAKMKKGDKVLIHAGSGGIGTFAIQYAKSQGAIVYTTTSTKNVEWVKKLGADRVIDYKTENYLEILKDVDIVYDTLGGNYTLDAFKILKKGGKVISIAGEIDEYTATQFGLNKFIRLILAFKRRKITKQAKLKSAYYRFLMMVANGSQLDKIGKLLEDGSIKPIVDKVFDFNDAKEALKYQKSGRAKGKIIIKMK